MFAGIKAGLYNQSPPPPAKNEVPLGAQEQGVVDRQAEDTVRNALAGPLGRFKAKKVLLSRRIGFFADDARL